MRAPLSTSVRQRPTSPTPFAPSHPCHRHLPLPTSHPPAARQLPPTSCTPATHRRRSSGPPTTTTTHRPTPSPAIAYRHPPAPASRSPVARQSPTNTRQHPPTPTNTRQCPPTPVSIRHPPTSAHHTPSHPTNARHLLPSAYQPPTCHPPAACQQLAPRTDISNYLHASAPSSAAFSGGSRITQSGFGSIAAGREGHPPATHHLTTMTHYPPRPALTPHPALPHTAPH